MKTQQELMDMMQAMLQRLVDDFNEYSELVALNYEQKKEGKFDESSLQWNRGHLSQIEEYMKMLAEKMGVGVRFKYKPHIFGQDDWKRTLEYWTVELVPPRVLYAEWSRYMKSYRLFDPKKPYETVVYVEDLDNMRNPETRVVEVDADTMHVECF